MQDSKHLDHDVVYDNASNHQVGGGEAAKLMPLGDAYNQAGSGNGGDNDKGNLTQTGGQVTVGNDLVYGGAATAWDPPPADREAMRDLASVLT